MTNLATLPQLPTRPLRVAASTVLSLGAAAAFAMLGASPASAVPDPVDTYPTDGDAPYGLTVTPDGLRGVVGNVGTGTFVVMDLDPTSPTLGDVLGTFPATPYSVESTYAPLDGLVYVPECGGSTYAVDATAVAIIATLPVGGCYSAVSPDGKRLFLGEDSAINVVDVDPSSPGYQTATSIPNLSHHLGGVAVSPDGLRLYSVATIEGVISMFDIDPLSPGYGLPIVADVPVGPNSLTPTLSLDGLRVFVADLDDGLLRVYDDALDPIGTVPIGASAAIATVGPGGLLYVTSPTDGTVVVIDPVSLAMVETWPSVGAGPAFIGFSPDGATAYVTNAVAPGTLTVMTGVTVPVPPGGGGGGSGGGGGTQLAHTGPQGFVATGVIGGGLVVAGAIVIIARHRVARRSTSGV